MDNKLFLLNIPLELNLFPSPTAPWDPMMKVKEQWIIEQKKGNMFLTFSFKFHAGYNM